MFVLSGNLIVVFREIASNEIIRRFIIPCLYRISSRLVGKRASYVFDKIPFE